MSRGSRTIAILKGLAAGGAKRSRDAVERFERELAAYFDAPDAVALWKGRVALYAALRALNIGPGDEVLMPGYTCVVVPNAVRYVGATPRYAEIDPATYNVNRALLEQRLTDRTRAIIVQHTYGVAAPMDEIMALGQERGLPVIEDGCHAFGTRYRGRLCGTFGVASFFSGQWSKPFSTGLGGWLVVNDADLAATVRRLVETEGRRPGLVTRFVLAAQLLAHHMFVFPRSFMRMMRLYRWLGRHGLAIGSSSMGEVSGEMPEDYFRRMSAVQAAVGRFEMGRLEDNVAHRKALSDYYDRALAGAGWATPRVPGECEPVYVRYPVRAANKADLLALAARESVELGDWFDCPLHAAESDLSDFGYQSGSCAEAEKASLEVVNLPVHPRTSRRAAERTVRFLIEYAQKPSAG